jgi:N-acetylglutamate synthase-like GNAT family acetyltransferase
MTLTLRLANHHDSDWINHCYEQAQFSASNIAEEILVIADINGSNAGLGRLIPLDEQSWELGGMYVLPEFREQGIAGAIVEKLLEQVPADTIYCIPFIYLLDFYMRFGFIDCDPASANLPLKLIEKFSFCAQSYQQKVALLIKQPALIH